MMIGTATAALLLGASTAGAGFEANDTMVIDPTSGPPGTVITVSGEDCSTKGDTFVEVRLYDTEDVLQDEATAEVDESGFSGDWETTLTVPAGTTDYGDWTVEGDCMLRDFPALQDARAGRRVVLPAQEPSRLLFPYVDALFTVTQPAPTPSSTSTPTTAPAAAAAPAVVAAPTFTG